MKINIPQINPKNIKSIIFDLGGVILDIDINKTIAAFDQLNIKGVSTKDILTDNQPLFHQLEIGIISPQEFINALRQTHRGVENVSENQIWEAWNALLLTFKKERIDLLKNLRESYNIYLLSNTNLPHRTHFKELYKNQFGDDFEHLFTRCFYSDEMHLRKPNTEIYLQVAKAIGSNSDDILFIDDLQVNIDEAKACGWNAYCLKNNESIIDLFKI